MTTPHDPRTSTAAAYAALLDAADHCDPDAVRAALDAVHAAEQTTTDTLGRIMFDTALSTFERLSANLHEPPGRASAPHESTPARWPS